ncbi:MAG: hypothetical protein IPJ98_22035 [Bryobacterales bacterium]|nr:hypothetical protein [Bryobacterales bacterium]
MGLLFLSAGVLRSAQDAPPVALTVYMRDAGACPVRVLDEMQAETAAILRPAGITLAWRHFPHAGQCDPVPALIVLTFAGACRGEGRCEPAGRSVALGWTHRTDGEILPFCVVDCDRVRQVVNPAIQHMPVEVRNYFYGRALGLWSLTSCITSLPTPRHTHPAGWPSHGSRQQSLFPGCAGSPQLRRRR